MKIRLGALLGALILIPSSGFAAPAQMHACALLTAGEIAGAVGGPAGRSQEQNITIPEGPSKGETMGGCMWRLGAQDMLSVGVMSPTKKVPVEQVKTLLDKAIARLP